MSNVEFYTQLTQHQSMLHNFALSLTKDMEDAKDLYQETAFRALSNKDKFQTGTNFKAWLATIMKNIFINSYRRKQKGNTVQDTSENQYLLNSINNSIGNSAESEIMMAELFNMIDKMDESIRTPFMRYYHGYKYQEIADEMNLPLGTVKSRIFFARKAMKDMLEKNYGFSEN